MMNYQWRGPQNISDVACGEERKVKTISKAKLHLLTTHCSAEKKIRGGNSSVETSRTFWPLYCVSIALERSTGFTAPAKHGALSGVTKVFTVKILMKPDLISNTIHFSNPIYSPGLGSHHQFSNINIVFPLMSYS